MSADLHLQRFDPSSDDGPRRPGIIADLASLARRVLADEGQADADVETAADGQTVTIDLDGGTAELHATHGSFPQTALDRTGIRLAFEVAREGDMAIVIEGGKYRAILTDPRQWDSLPPDWIEDRAQAPVCCSAAELETLLGDWFGVHGRYADQVRRELSERAAPLAGAVPGTQPDERRDHIYVQAKPRETAIKHLRAASKYYRTAYEAGAQGVPKSGAIGGTSWRLETPTGEAFYALWVSDDKVAWWEMVRSYARSTDRAVGRIVNGDRFVLDDGRSFPLSACTCAKVKE